jgi:hypothetical protein
MSKKLQTTDLINTWIEEKKNELLHLADLLLAADLIITALLEGLVIEAVENPKKFSDDLRIIDSFFEKMRSGRGGHMGFHGSKEEIEKLSHSILEKGPNKVTDLSDRDLLKVLGADCQALDLALFSAKIFFNTSSSPMGIQKFFRKIERYTNDAISSGYLVLGYWYTQSPNMMAEIIRIYNSIKRTKTKKAKRKQIVLEIYHQSNDKLKKMNPHRIATRIREKLEQGEEPQVSAPSIKTIKRYLHEEGIL